MLQLIDLTNTPKRFFEILPPDWRIEIEPFWPDYAPDSSIFGLADNDEIVAGGIIFSTVSPDMMHHSEAAQSWFDKGFRYIGFLFVKEDRRNEGLGSHWFREIKKQFPQQKFWLAIEDFGLSRFYGSLGFELVQELKTAEHSEWVLVEKS